MNSDADAKIIRQLAHNRDIARHQRAHRSHVQPHQIVGVVIVVITVALVAAVMMF